MHYDDWGALQWKVDFNGYRIDYAFDAMGRMTRMEAATTHPSLFLPHAPQRQTYTWYEDGQPEYRRVFNAAGELLHEEHFAYDSRSRLNVKTSPQGILAYGYDDASNLTAAYSNTVGGLNLSYTYDDLNRLKTVSNLPSPAPSLAEYAYNPNGSLASVAYANGLRHEYQYDALNRLRHLDILKADSSVLHSYAYHLSPSGHRRSMLESTGRLTQWDYDAHNRLIRETINVDLVDDLLGQVDYGYDAVGNRRSRVSTLGPISNQSFTYNPNDWLERDTYDSNGNTLQSPASGLQPSTTDTYSFENLLIRRITATGDILDYEYNCDGILVAKTKNGLREEYLIDAHNPTGYAQVVETFTMNGPDRELSAVHEYGHDLIRQITIDSSFLIHPSYFLYDGLGSVRFLADDTGTITDRYVYDAFGNALVHSGTTVNPYRYTGERYDEDLGMYYLRARYMNPNTGRFWTMDSYEGRSADPISLHKYLYANGNGVMYVDPNGQFTLTETQSVAILTGTLTGMVVGGINKFLHGYQSGKKGWELAEETSYGVLTGGLIGTAAGAVFSITPTWLLSKGYVSATLTGIAIGGSVYESEMAWVEYTMGNYYSGAAHTFNASLSFGSTGIWRLLAPKFQAAKTTTGAADDAAKWIWGQNKGVAKSIRQMDQRGWVPEQVTEAIKTGQQFPATNLVNKGNPAIRYVHPTTGQSVVQDTVTKEIIHFGGPGFKY